MGALRINLTDGTSTFIDLSNATSVNVANCNEQKFTIIVDGQGYDVIRFDTTGNLGDEVIWTWQMLAAYVCIAADPIRYGYPNLGNNYETYIQYDDEKFLASAIDSALSNIAEPAVLSNRTALAIDIVSSDEAKDLGEQIDNERANCEDEASILTEDCEKAVTDPACVNGFDFGGIICSCGDAACCEATKQTYIKNCLSGVLDGIRIDWKHQYLFKTVTNEGP